MITSSANAKVKQIVQWQSKAKERRQAGVFTTEGFKMFEEAPADDIKEVFLSQDALERAKGNSFIWKKLQQTGYETVSSNVFAKMSDTQSPQGILTVLRQPKYDIENILKRGNPLLLVVEDLQDPGNLGTMFRTGEGAGITGVIMSSDTVDIFNPKVVRATMGSIYRVPFVYAGDLRNAVNDLHKNGIAVYAAHLEGETYYNRLSFREPTAFLIGNEGKGLRRDTAKLADSYVKIPMEGRVESLNAAVAAALLLYETHRQRHV